MKSSNAVNSRPRELTLEEVKMIAGGSGVGSVQSSAGSGVGSKQSSFGRGTPQSQAWGGGATRAVHAGPPKNIGG